MNRQKRIELSIKTVREIRTRVVEEYPMENDVDTDATVKLVVDVYCAELVSDFLNPGVE